MTKKCHYCRYLQQCPCCPCEMGKGNLKWGTWLCNVKIRFLDYFQLLLRILGARSEIRKKILILILLQASIRDWHSDKQAVGAWGASVRAQFFAVAAGKSDQPSRTRFFFLQQWRREFNPRSSQCYWRWYYYRITFLMRNLILNRMGPVAFRSG